MSEMNTVPQRSNDLNLPWWCDCCRVQQQGPLHIYAIKLCLTCINKAATDPGFLHHHACRAYVM